MSEVDYAALIDAQTRRFIERTNAAFGENAAALSVSEQRTRYDAMCRGFHAGYPANVYSEDNVVVDADDWQVPIRTYHSQDHRITTTPVATPHLIYAHGGGFVVGGLDSHDDICAELCAHTGFSLTSVDYRLSPEHKHPAALHDVMLIIDHIGVSRGHPVVLCGDSAGANLIAASCHALRNRQRERPTAAVDILGQVLIYPGLGGDTRQGSYINHANAPMLSTHEVEYYARLRCSNTIDYHDTLVAPLLDIDNSQLPPTVAFSAECDPLSDDARHYCTHIIQAGGQAHWIHEQGLVHGYLRARHTVERARHSVDRMKNALSALGARQWPY